MKLKLFLTVGLLSACMTFSAQAALTLSVSFTLQADTDLTVSEKAMFSDAVSFWGSYLTGYRDGISRNWNLQVNTFDQAASGGGVLLGYAGPGSLAFSGVVAGVPTSNNRFILSTSGTASFNTHPDAGTLNLATLKHEIGHALGFGTLWEDNEVYNDGVAGNSNRTSAVGTPGSYHGAFGLAAFQYEFDPTATSIQIERDGGDGTADGHWNERADNIFEENVAGADSDPGDGAPAPFVLLAGPNFGKSLDNELMTGMLSGDAFLSNTTVQSFRDLGFTVVPEPASAICLVLGAGTLIWRRRR